MRAGIIAFLKVVFLIYCLSVTQRAVSQCSTTIISFPYQQDFETGDGSWFPGPSGAEWKWGTPAKPVINTAANGIRCWVVNSLSGTSYPSGASWLQSPCFDFSSLQYPYIKFQVFWEMEKKYDGANFQYSVDLGRTWNNVGSAFDAVNCLNGNWFNASSINYLPGGEGWSGNQQSSSGSCQGGGGSNGWVISQHCMPELAGKASVIFRFSFGAGTQCNDYDGFAVDDIAISEAPANQASFTYSCGSNNKADFTNTSILCPKTFLWNFDDPLSGTTNNSSSLANPSHIFSTPGIHNVSLTVSGPGNAPSTITIPITTINVTASVTATPGCFGDDNGSATVTVTGSPGPFNYNWNTSPAQSGSVATNLKSGNYTVTITGPDVCATTQSVLITEPLQLTNIISVTQPCGASTGTATIIVSGGTPPYTYSWSPSGGNSNFATTLFPGTYTVTVKDKNGCIDTGTTDIISNAPPVVTVSTKTNVSCQGGNNGSAAVIATGSGPFEYSWKTVPVQAGPSVSNLRAGTYTVITKDINGCTDNTVIQITEPAGAITLVQSITGSTCELSNGAIQLTTSGGVPPYNYLWTGSASTTANADNLKAGNYTVIITESNGCNTKIDNIPVNNMGERPRVNLGNETSFCPGQLLVLKPGSYKQYLWQDNSTSPTFTVTATGKYWVRVINDADCIGSDTVIVSPVVNCDDIFFPSSFTPNSDGLNDLFGPIGNIYAVSDYLFIIYNRWGVEVFKSNNPFEKWNGTLRSELTGNASYVWQASYTFKGSPGRIKKGTVTIIK